MTPSTDLSLAGHAWLQVVVDTAALRANLAEFRRLVRPPARLMPVVKADGYGHGLLIAARAFLAGGADWFAVHSVAEARRLRDGGFTTPVLVLGPATPAEAALAAELDCDLTVGSLAGLRAVAAAGRGRVHLKVETGVNRQGIVEAELRDALSVLAGAPRVALVGVSSHFADIEDTTDHAFARRQRERFDAWLAQLGAAGYPDLLRHMSCSAAAVLWPDLHRDLVRVGISAYGIWPSRETLVSARQSGHADLALRQALSWEVRVSQVRDVPAGETVGYGRTWLAPVDSRIAVLPVGYSDGYPRSLSGRAHVLIHGRRAPICGRICMNLCMADVTRIPAAAAGDPAVLLGRQGDDAITVEQLADWLGTITYEVLTLPRATWRFVEAGRA
ncbi:MAG TPA: alanine racemase [Candidatus Krumholzibacteria bacterium]|nr:alanine racemase [Candidatus Krumholzibacteria bacterium]HPD72183.1 alanine racemase [Candidatus Krumholzibacteria bacterium]HRY40885.1 alanine racemase [Candidatus Krumholzibacteria bacterium]